MSEIANKPGLKTSELWVSVSTILGYLALALNDVDISEELGTVGSALPGVVAAAYAVSRAVVKVRGSRGRGRRSRKDSRWRRSTR